MLLKRKVSSAAVQTKRRFADTYSHPSPGMRLALNPHPHTRTNCCSIGTAICSSSQRKICLAPRTYVGLPLIRLSQRIATSKCAFNPQHIVACGRRSSLTCSEFLCLSVCSPPAHNSNIYRGDKALVGVAFSSLCAPKVDDRVCNSVLRHNRPFDNFQRVGRGILSSFN
jgi:hypothetical protein